MSKLFYLRFREIYATIQLSGLSVVANFAAALFLVGLFHGLLVDYLRGIPVGGHAAVAVRIIVPAQGIGADADAPGLVDRLLGGLDLLFALLSLVGLVGLLPDRQEQYAL